MKNNRLKNISNDFGFTLIELTLSIILTSIFAGTMIQMTAQATKSIDGITQKAVKVQTAIRYSNLLRYDFNGSQEVYIHSFTPPPITATICSSYSSSDLTNVWTAPVSGKRYVRALFTLKVASVPITPGLLGNSEVFTPVVPTLVGYEIRQSVTYPNPNYELWRVMCPGTGGAPTRSEKLLDLGATAGSKITALRTSSNYISCFNSLGLYSCPVEYATKILTTYYTFLLPYDEKSYLLRQLQAAENQNLLTRIDN